METHRLASGSGSLTGTSAEEDPAGWLEAFAALQRDGRLPATGVAYDPYGPFETQGEVVAVLQGNRLVSELEAGNPAALVLPRTSFYVEAGGQVSDTGTIRSDPEGAWEFLVEEMREPAAGFVLHVGRVSRGTLRVGDPATAAVDAQRRWDIMRNHTATHLLHASLRAVLGSHARQAGSLVAPDRLRFDFTHGAPLSADEVVRIQAMVASAIFDNLPTLIDERERAQAEAEGAMALFGETYGDNVRTISIGQGPRFSYELCGGTHVPHTGVIGPFVIVREESVGSGLRRVEALTGRQAQAYLERTLGSLQRVADLLGSTPDRVEDQLRAVLEQRQALEARLAGWQHSRAEAALAQIPESRLGSAAALLGVIPDSDADGLRRLSDGFRDRNPTHVVVLGTETAGKPMLVAAVSPDLVERGVSAVDLVRHAAEAIGGGGGGRPTMAQAGGKDASGLARAIDLARVWVERRLSDTSG